MPFNSDPNNSDILENFNFEHFLRTTDGDFNFDPSTFENGDGIETRAGSESKDPFAGIEGCHVVRDGWVEDQDGNTIGILVDGNVKCVFGLAVKEDGDIVNEHGSIIGHAEPYAEPEFEEAEASLDGTVPILKGLAVNKQGYVIGPEGVPIAHFVDGNVKELAGKKCDEKGQLWNDSGKVIGRCELISDNEREAKTEGPFAGLEGCVVVKEGFVEDEAGNRVRVVVEGDTKRLVGRAIDDDGDIIDIYGNVKGHASIDKASLLRAEKPSALAPDDGAGANGGSRAAVPVPFAGDERVRTPTDIMRERRDREGRKKAKSERVQREQDRDEQRRIQEEQQLEQDTAGVAQIDEKISYWRSGGAVRRSTGEPTSRELSERGSGDRASQDSIRANIPSTTQPSAYALSNGRAKKSSANTLDDDSGIVALFRTRTRGVTASTGQPRRVEVRPRQTSRVVSMAAAAAGGQKEYKNRIVSAAAAPYSIQDPDMNFDSLDSVLDRGQVEWWQRESERGDSRMADIEVVDRLVSLWTTVKPL